jgi:hypothetical protein
MQCSYCGKLISENNKSQEHIIQNALGGILESKNICCNKCNNIVQEKIDNNFCRIFNPLITQIKNLKKTNSSSMPSCEGKAKYIDDMIYDVTIKNGVVITSYEYKRKYKKELSKTDLKNFKIVDYGFKIDDNIFNQGICKIAYNYAIDQGIQKNKIDSVLNVEKIEDEIKEIAFNAEVIPFVPLNAFDKFLELEASLELTHILILFTHKNHLICYVDLFNTFQNYVILSDTWDGREIYKSYYQVIEKIDRTLPEFDFLRYKDIHIVATSYGVDPTPNIDVLNKDIKKVIDLKPYAKDIQEYISNNFSHRFSESPLYDIGEKYRSVSFYLDDDEILYTNRFRRYTPSSDRNNAGAYDFYPEIIINLLKNDEKSDVKNYYSQKLNRLNHYLSHSNNED